MNERHLDDWNTLLDQLLRGVSHSLSNRAVALSAMAALQQDDDPEIRELVPAELVRLQELNRLLRLLPAETRTAVQALDARDVVRDVVAFMELHPRHRDALWVVRGEAAPLPVRTRRWMLMRTLLLACDAIARDATSAGAGEVALECRGDDGTVTVEVRAIVVATPDVPPTAATLAKEIGAGITPAPGSLAVTLPSLAAVREREQGGSEVGPR